MGTQQKKTKSTLSKTPKKLQFKKNNQISYKLINSVNLNSIQPEEKQPDLLENSKKYNINYKKIIKSLVIASSIPLFGAITAFSIAPDTITNPQIIRIEKQIDFDKTTLNSSDKNSYVLEEVIKPNDTIQSILARTNIQFNTELLNLLNQNQKLKDIKIIGNNSTILFESDENNAFKSLRYRSGLTTELEVKVTPHSSKHYIISEHQLKLASNMVDQTFEIQDAITDANFKKKTVGISESLADNLYEIFYKEIDLFKSLKKGDKIRVISDGFFYNDELIEQGKIKAVHITFSKPSTKSNAKKELIAFYYKNQYYSEQGYQFKPAFLETPVEFGYPTSPYSEGRMHPILGIVRPHLGVDFSAPEGARVKSTAQGIVSFIGEQGGYGNVIIVDHPKGYSTAYAHLSAFNPTLSVGDKVGQGEVLAYVGTTGLSTGPHVHYELRIHGKQVDPFGEQMPRQFTLEGKFLDAYKKDIAQYADRLHNVDESQIMNNSASSTLTFLNHKDG